jgi:hypothetical protein
MPDPTLQGTALRYAAGDLSPGEADAFEARLAADQDARDALAEAVRLSAAAIGQKPPAPDPSVRAASRARLVPRGSGSPFAWVGLGGSAVAVCTLVALTLADHNPPHTVPLSGSRLTPVRAEGAPPPHAPDRPTAPAPMPHETASPVVADLTPPATCGDESRTVAEIWADLSTPERVEKAHDDELRLRQHMRNLQSHHVSAPAKAAAPTDGPQP